MALLMENAGLFGALLPAPGQWPVLGEAHFDDKTERVHAGILGPGETVPVRSLGPKAEEAHIFLGAAVLLGGGTERPLPRPAATATFCGCCHGFANRGAAPLRYLRVVVGPEGAEPAVVPGDTGRGAASQELDVGLVEEFWAHEGLGMIKYRRLWGLEDFTTKFGFVDHCVVPPGTSVGYHRHDTVQECYLIIRGEGVMKVDGEVGRVVPGDCVPNRLGGSHGLINGGAEPVEFINIAVCQHKGEWDATNLGDDLSDLI